MIRTLLLAMTILPNGSLGWVQPGGSSQSLMKMKQQHKQQHGHHSRHLGPLHVSFTPGVLGEEYYHHYGSQEEAKSLMERANECAHSDSCSVEDALMYLQDVIHVQSDCVTGTLVGKDLCENQDNVADIVAHLREKVARAGKSAVGVSAISNKVHQRALDQGAKGAGFALMASAMFFLAMGVTVGIMQQPQQMDTVPFTMQEWWWSIRDGYFPTMVEYWFRNGGLVVDIEKYFSSNDMLNSVIMPYTLQEWWWAIRDGYLDTMLYDNFRNGGLLVSSAADIGGGSIVSPTPQEWLWAVRDGYADTMMQHVFRNGGLVSSADAATTDVPFAAREWIWAIQGGYLDTMVDHFMRNGGV